MLWEDGDAEYTFLDRRGNVTGRVDGTWWTDSDDDTRLEFGEGNDGQDYSMAFTKPSSDYGVGAHYRPRSPVNRALSTHAWWWPK